MPEGRALILLFNFGADPPYTIGQNLLFSGGISNLSLTTDTFFVTLRDTTVNQVLFRVEFLAPLLGIVNLSGVAFTVQGPAGIHEWVLEAGHLE